MITEEREKIVASLVNCMNLFHDALFTPERINDARAMQLKRLIKDVELQHLRTKKFTRNKFKYHLLYLLQQVLGKVYEGVETLDFYNNVISTDAQLAYYCDEVKISKDDLLLNQNELEAYMDGQRSGINGPQELAVSLIEGASKTERAGMSKSSQLANYAKVKQAFSQFKREDIRNPIIELNRLNNIIYQAQWFGRTDRKVADLQIVSV